jgi:hypothetical protein
MLSPKKSEAPKTPSAASASFVRRPPRTPRRLISVMSARMPPLAVVVGAHHEQHVGDGDDEGHRPEDQGDDTEHALTGDGDRMRIARVEDGLDRVQRTRAYVTEHDAERAERQCRLSTRPVHAFDPARPVSALGQGP